MPFGSKRIRGIASELTKWSRNHSLCEWNGIFIFKTDVDLVAQLKETNAEECNSRDDMFPGLIESMVFARRTLIDDILRRAGFII